ncbi:hypothetical protein SASPL_100946 [Salvia splendens]|uniref:RecF/RecN/SMC N-terminal domain-containing protein n=1 Tax=Salvia splendens TaxID=180675 RepID=A0A8X9ADK8_SALSN|nr:hypothetical protein SASPL_100946 [Salvia splendens]
MYIKQVVIEGFKSYREQISTETFSPKVNCVVGANGSGKSNFFHAIRFVISDLFHNLRNEERQALLHEGAGHQVLSALVEIVFDNSDNRIPVDKEEVRLRRTIGVKKGEYFLDGKHITYEDRSHESAGKCLILSFKSLLCCAAGKDSERLDLLKEIGGTRVYEERRRESLKIMQDTGKRPWVIFSAHFALESNQCLLQIDEDRYRVSEKSATMYNSVSDAHEKCKELDKLLKDLTKEAQILSREKEAIKKRAKLELDNKDFDDKIKGNIRAKEDAVIQLELLKKEIEESNAELTRIKTLHDLRIREEERLTLGIMEREKKLSILYQKQGRATQFGNKADRDRWLTKEIKDYEQVLSSNLVQADSPPPNQQRANADRPLENGLDLGIYKAILVGQVGQAPIQKRLRSGKTVTLISLGTGGIRNNRRPLDNEEPRDYANRCAVQWHRVSVYPDRLGELAAKKLAPGSTLYVEGNLETKIFNDPITGLVRRIREIAVRRNGRILVLGNGGEAAQFSRTDMSAIGYY